MKTSQPPKTPYEAKLKIMGKTFTAKGKSVPQAISGLDIGRMRGIGVLTISKGKVSKDKIISMPQVARLFTLSPLMREVALKQVSNLFDI